MRDVDPRKLPRGRGLSLSGPMMFRILFTAALLVAVVVLRKPCADATGRFVNSFDPVDAGVGTNGSSGSAGGSGAGSAAMPGLPPGAQAGDVIPLGDLNEAEVRAVYERLQREAGIGVDAGAGAGSASATDAGAAGPAGAVAPPR